MRGWSGKTEIRESRLVSWIGLGRSKFYNWRDRYGRVNEHNEQVPRDRWLEPGEVDAIVRFRGEHPHDGYRALTYMMMDADVVAASPSSVYRVLKRRGLLARWNRTASKKGTGFVQPLEAHEHWHTDVTYVNVRGTFFYLASLLDGFSRYIVHWEIREQMTERDVETIVQRAVETFPDAKPRIISDNGPQFIARDFKAFVRQCGMTHVKTSPYYPQSNGKIERWHQSLKNECIRPGTPLSLDDARRIVGQWIGHYNTVRLHSAIDYIAPKDKLEGRAEAILAARDAKLAAAREQRRIKRQQLRQNQILTIGTPGATLHSAGEAEASVAGEHLARNSRPGCDGYPSGGVEQTGSLALHAAQKDIQSIPHAFLNSDLPEASRHLTREGDLSNSR